MLLPYATLFVVLLLATLHLGARADRAEDAGRARVQARLTTAAAVPSAVAGLAVAGLVIGIGHAGATAAWQGVIST
jgi:hypothetical protein